MSSSFFLDFTAIASTYVTHLIDWQMPSDFRAHVTVHRKADTREKMSRERRRSKMKCCVREVMNSVQISSIKSRLFPLLPSLQINSIRLCSFSFGSRSVDLNFWRQHVCECLWKRSRAWVVEGNVSSTDAKRPMNLRFFLTFSFKIKFFGWSTPKMACFFYKICRNC